MKLLKEVFLYDLLCVPSNLHGQIGCHPSLIRTSYDMTANVFFSSLVEHSQRGNEVKSLVFIDDGSAMVSVTTARQTNTGLRCPSTRWNDTSLRDVRRVCVKYRVFIFCEITR